MKQRYATEFDVHKDGLQPSPQDHAKAMPYDRYGRKLSLHDLCLIVVFAVLTTLTLYTAPALADEAASTLKTAIKSGCEYDYPPFCIVEKDGVANGFAVELLRAALQKMGHDVTFSVGPWTEVKGLLEHGKIEALPLVGRTPEREAIFDFTFPYLSLHGVIVVPKGTTGIHDLNDLKGRQVAVMAGDNAEEFLRRTELDIDIQTTRTFDEALRELSDGRHDAVVIQRLLALRLLQKSGITNLEIIDKPLEGLQQDFCFAVKEGDKKTLSLLNEGLALVMADGTFSRLQAKWFAALELPINDCIVVGGDHNYPPYEFLDENGHQAGYNVELTRALAKVTGLEIDIRLGPWAEIKQGLADGRIDAIHGMFYSPERGLDFAFSPPHTVIQHIAIVRKGEGAPPGNIANLKGKHVVVMQGDIMHDWLLKKVPEVEFTTVADQETALRELAAGKYDCALLARVPAMYWINKFELKNLNITGRPLLTPEYCYAVPRDQKVLLAKLTEGMKTLHDSGEYQRIYAKWMGVYDEQPPSLTTILRYLALVVIPLLLLILLFWSRTLRKQVNFRTAELQEGKTLLQTVVDGVPDSLMVINRDYTIALANRAAMEMAGEDPVSACLKCHQVSHDSIMPCGGKEHSCPLQEVIETKAPVTVEHVHLDAQGRQMHIELSAAPIFDEQGEVLQVIELCHDITERKLRENSIEAQLRLSEFSVDHSVAELLQAFLDEAEKLTSSEMGFFHFVEKDQVNLHLQTWSTNTLKNLCSAEGAGEHYPIDKAGVWVDCVRDGNPVVHNDYASLPHRKGLPEGHVPVVRELVVPVQRGNRIVAIFGVGNKQTDYREEDVETVQNLANMAWDIVSRKHAEEALLESKNRYHQMFEDNLSVKLIIDPSDGRIVEANQAALNYYGYDAETFCSKRISEINTLSEEKIKAEMELAKEEKRRFFNFSHRLSSGEIRDVEVYSGPIKSGDKTLLYSIIHDTTKRKIAEKALREASQFRENIISESPVGTAIYDATTGQCLTVNKSMAEMAGAKVEQMLTQNFYEIESWKKSGLMDVAASSLQDDAQKHREVNMTTTFGKTLSADCYFTPFIAGDKRYLLFNLLDITARKRAEEESLKLEAQLRHSQKMEAVGQLAGGVAHDFNNLLQVILGYSDVVLSGDGEVSTTRTSIVEIMKAAERAKTLVQQLLAFSHRQVLDIEDVNLNQVVTDLMKIIQRVIGNHITLEIIYGHDLGTVRADPGQIDQILMNLCVNARDAMPAGGTITIETENVRIDKDYCENNAWAKPGHYVLLSVTDTGCGMSDEIIENAFEPFFTTKSVGKGTGLGLSMVYGLVTQHKGMINVYSEIDKGTTFKIYLPLIERSAAAVGDKIESPVAGGSETILVVEDEKVVREMCQLFLKTAGYKVLIACNGEEAIRVLEERADEIDLVLLDVMMPKIGGRAVYEHIHKTGLDIRVLFSSGYSMNAIHTNFILDEGLTLIQKPFLRDDLLRSIRIILDKQ